MWAGSRFLRPSATVGRTIDFKHRPEFCLDTGGGNWPGLYCFLGYGGQTFTNGGTANNRLQADNFQLTTTAFITPVAVKASSNYGGFVPSTNLINSSGLSENTIQGTHDNNGSAQGMWHAGDTDDGLGGPVGFPPAVNTQKVWFDLGQAYDLTDLYVWNHNQEFLTGRGVKDLEIFYSTDNSLFSSAGLYQFAQAGGTPTQSAQNLSLTAASARYVRFDIISDWNGAANDYVGLSEVRFGGIAVVPVPEPTSVALLACGAITILALRRRRASCGREGVDQGLVQATPEA